MSAIIELPTPREILALHGLSVQRQFRVVCNVLVPRETAISVGNVRLARGEVGGVLE